MPAQAPADSGLEALEFAGRPSWLAIVLAVVPALVVLQSLYVLAVKPVPVILVVLLIAMMLACGLLGAKALEGVLPTSVALTQHGIDVSRTFGSQTYAWHEIEDIKLVPAPGTMADDPNRSLANRIGIGLFLKAKSKDREDDNLADVVLFVGTDEDTSQLMGIMERITAFRARKLGPARGPAKIGARRGPVRAQNQFRRKQDAAAG